MAVGPRNLITDVAGLTVGNADDLDLRSGVTVVLPEFAMVAAADVRGGAPATRDMDGLTAGRLVERIHGIALSGGSGFGLDAGGGLQSWLAAEGRGIAFGGATIPVVPTAILFDLVNGGNKDWGRLPPYRALAEQAAKNAGLEFQLGNSGAGMGATAADLKGGLGSASWQYTSAAGQKVTVAALAAVNPMGSVLMPETGCFWAWPFAQEGELGAARLPSAPLAARADFVMPGDGPAPANTTLVVVATDAALDKAQAQRVAIMAQDGLARAIRPIHSPFDGDVVICVSTEKVAIDGSPQEIAQIGHHAADCAARAIARGVYEADSIGDWQSYRDRFAAA